MSGEQVKPTGAFEPRSALGMSSKASEWANWSKSTDLAVWTELQHWRSPALQVLTGTLRGTNSFS